MLKQETEQIISAYFNLPFKKISGIACPYFNNVYAKHRAGLRAQIGKGSPEEIAEEAEIISHQYENDFLQNSDTSPVEVKKFLLEHGLGIDCSGFASQILKAEHPNFMKKINFGKIGIWRKIICRLRPLENLSVNVYADNANTKLVARGGADFNLSMLKPLDLIIMIDMPRFKNLDHILIITEVAKDFIKYVHSRNWLGEDLELGGVHFGTINITNPGKSLLEQEWVEKGLTGEQNQTYAFKAKEAKRLEIRRLKRTI